MHPEIQYIEQIFFAVFVLSILTFFDVLIKFKRPLILKFHFLAIVFAIGLSSFIHSIDLFTNRYIYLIIFSKSVIASSFLNIFSILYFPKFKLWVTSISIFLVAFTIYSYYYSAINNPNYIYSLKAQTLVIVKSEQLTIPLFAKIIRVILIGSFFITFIYFLYSILNKYKLNNIYFNKIKYWTIGIFILIVNMLLLYIPFPFIYNNVYVGYYISIYLYLYIVLLIFYRPQFLNKSSMKISFGFAFNKDAEFVIKDLQFINAFYTNQYYTDNTASLENFAKLLNVGSNDLYKFVYYKYSMTFNDLVNKHRVDYFVDIIHDPKFLNFTIDALAKEAGFSSRQHLYKPFKKFHGGNPSDLVDATAN